MKIALAGFAQGYYAVNYIRYLHRLRQVDIIAVCDLNETEEYTRECAFISAEEFAVEVNAILLHDYTKLLDLSPDAILICSETVKHVEMAKAAIDRGIHTFVAKPLCFSSVSAESLALCKPSRTCLLCGNPLKYEASILEMKKRVRNGEIGTLYSLRIVVNHLAMIKQRWERDPKKSGGPLGTYGIYLFDLQHWISGITIEELYAIGGNFATPEITVCDTVKIVAKGQDVQFSLELYSAIRHNFPFIQLEAVGTSGTLISHNDAYTSLLQTESGSSFGELRQTDMGMAEMEHFLKCINGTESECCTVDDMIYVSRCIEAAQHSMYINTPVRIEIEG